MKLVHDVELQSITFENFNAVIALKLHPDQEKNLPSNVYSIAESSLSPFFYPRAICADGEVAGFLMYEFGAPGAFDEGECTIWRFMIDLSRQNTGLGTRAMALVLEEIKAHNRCSLVEIYYDPKNLIARRLYASYGFKEVGSRDDGDTIAVLNV